MPEGDQAAETSSEAEKTSQIYCLVQSRNEDSAVEGLGAREKLPNI